MIRKYQKNLVIFIFFLDIGVICFSWGASYAFRFYADILPIKYGMPETLPYFNSLLLILPIWIVSLFASSLYRIRGDFNLVTQFQKITISSSLSVLFLVFILFFLKDENQLSRLFLLTFWIFNISFLIIARYLVKGFLKKFRGEKQQSRQVLILGGGEISKKMVSKIQSMPWIGYRIIGFLDDATTERELGGIPKNVPCIGKIDETDSILSKEKIDTVFVTIGLDDKYLFEKLINTLSKYPINIGIVPNLFQYNLLANADIDDLSGLPIISILDSPMVGVNRYIKRAFDILFSFFVILFTFPLGFLIAFLIKLTSHGPVLYKQERVSLNGKRFNIYKFRSMPVDVESKSGPKWAEAGDNRSTKIGSFLRKTSIDEFPQFLNVLAGSMSVVGPRPERPNFVEQFRHDIPQYMLRHKMKAGITGWAQVNGWRGNTSLKKRIECDIFYINNWSLLLDIKIILITFYKGFINKNAY